MSLYPMLARIKELVMENEQLGDDANCDDYETKAYFSGKVKVLQLLLKEFTPVHDLFSDE